LRRTAAAAVAVACLAVPAVARADGDPASDYLLTQDVFFPFDAKVPTAQAGQLSALAASAKKKGFPIRIALIATRYDLGAITALWGQPQRYARFLGQELAFVYKDRLLIVMPAGYGIYDNRRPVARDQAVLAKLPPPGTTGPELASAAARAVQRLAKAHGVEVQLPPASGGDGQSQWGDRLLLIAIALTLIGVGLAAALGVRHRREAGARGAELP
jgi:hypothetical protein